MEDEFEVVASQMAQEVEASYRDDKTQFEQDDDTEIDQIAS